MTTKIPTYLLPLILAAACGQPTYSQVDWTGPAPTGRAALSDPAAACASGRGTPLTATSVACEGPLNDAPSAACGPDWGPCHTLPVSASTCASLPGLYLSEPAGCPLPAATSVAASRVAAAGRAGH